MKVTFETMGTRQVDVHYVNSGVTGIVENFEGYYLENSGLSLDELFHQETVYQSLQTENKDRASASAINNSEPHHDQGAEEGESSRVGVIESQLALDEALARTLQVLEDHQLLAASLDETTETETVHREENPVANSTALALRQDNVDPDNMAYEELQSLGEAIGTESRGLSEELIDYLPSIKYKTGCFFSRKDKHEQCVICYIEYKNREKLTILPCQHQYHSKCITVWLKLKKACPVCGEEVFG